MNNQRIYYLDVMRVFAIFLVVLMHSPHPKAGSPGYVQAPLYFIAAAGVPLFFMISGILLLPVKKKMFTFLTYRLKKITVPLVIWSSFYVIIKYIDGELSLDILFKNILSIPFSAQGIKEMWFLYPLLGIYLLAPLLSKFIISSEKQEILFYIILWIISLFFPLLKLLLEVDEGRTGILYYCTGYCGFFLIGYYLHHHRQNVNTLFCLILIIIPLIIYIIFRLMGWINSLSDWHFYLNICVVTNSVGWFLLIQRLFKTKLALNMGSFPHKKNIKEILEVASNCCFGVYLIHIFIMRHVLWKFNFIVYGFGGIGQIITTWFLTLLISFALTYLMSYLPFAGYIIGYKHKKQ